MVVTNMFAHPKSISSPKMKRWSALLIPTERFANNRQSSSLTQFTPSLRVPALEDRQASAA
jgi:hypothetical protein